MHSSKSSSSGRRREFAAVLREKAGVELIQDEGKRFLSSSSDATAELNVSSTDGVREDSGVRRRRSLHSVAVIMSQRTSTSAALSGKATTSTFTVPSSPVGGGGLGHSTSQHRTGTRAIFLEPIQHTPGGKPKVDAPAATSSALAPTPTTTGLLSSQSLHQQSVSFESSHGLTRSSTPVLPQESGDAENKSSNNHPKLLSSLQHLAKAKDADVPQPTEAGNTRRQLQVVISPTTTTPSSNGVADFRKLRLLTSPSSPVLDTSASSTGGSPLLVKEHHHPLHDWMLEVHSVFDLVVRRGVEYGETARCQLISAVVAHQAHQTFSSSSDNNSRRRVSHDEGAPATEPGGPKKPTFVDGSTIARAQSLDPASVRDCLTSRAQDPWTHLQGVAATAARSIVQSLVASTTTAAAGAPGASDEAAPPHLASVTPDGVFVYQWRRRVAAREFLKILSALASSRHALLLPAWVAVPLAVNVAWNGEIFSVVWLPPIRDPAPIESSSCVRTTSSPPPSSTPTLLTAISETLRGYFQCHRHARPPTTSPTSASPSPTHRDAPIWSFFVGHDDLLYICPGSGFTGIPYQGPILADSSMFERHEYVFLDRFPTSGPDAQQLLNTSQASSSTSLSTSVQPSSVVAGATERRRVMVAIEERLMPMFLENTERIVGWLTLEQSNSGFSELGRQSAADILSRCFHTCGVRLRSMLTVRRLLLKRLAAEAAASAGPTTTIQSKNKRAHHLLPSMKRAKAIEDLAQLILSEVVARSMKAIILRFVAKKMVLQMTEAGPQSASQQQQQQEDHQRHQQPHDDLGVSTNGQERLLDISYMDDGATPATTTNGDVASSPALLVDVATWVLGRVLRSRRFVTASLLPCIYRKFEDAHDVVLDMDQISLSVVVKHLERALGLTYHVASMSFTLPPSGTSSSSILHIGGRGSMDVASMLRREAVVADQVAAVDLSGGLDNHHDAGSTQPKLTQLCAPALLSLYYATVAVQNSIAGSENVLHGAIRRTATVLRMLEQSSATSISSSSTDKMMDERVRSDVVTAAILSRQLATLLGLTAGAYTGNGKLLDRMLRQAVLPVLATMGAQRRPGAPLAPTVVVLSAVGGHLLRSCSLPWNVLQLHDDVATTSRSNSRSDWSQSNNSATHRRRSSTAAGLSASHREETELCSRIVDGWLTACTMVLHSTIMIHPAHSYTASSAASVAAPPAALRSKLQSRTNSGNADVPEDVPDGRRYRRDLLDVLSISTMSAMEEWFAVFPQQGGGVVPGIAFRAVTAWCSPVRLAIADILQQIFHSDEELTIMSDRFTQGSCLKAALAAGIIIGGFRPMVAEEEMWNGEPRLRARTPPRTTTSAHVPSAAHHSNDSQHAAHHDGAAGRLFLWQWLVSSIRLLNTVSTSDAVSAPLHFVNVDKALFKLVAAVESCCEDTNEERRQVALRKLLDGAKAVLTRPTEAFLRTQLPDYTAIVGLLGRDNGSSNSGGWLAKVVVRACNVSSTSCDDDDDRCDAHDSVRSGTAVMIRCLEWCVMCALWCLPECAALEAQEAASKSKLEATITEEHNALLRSGADIQKQIELIKAATAAKAKSQAELSQRAAALDVQEASARSNLEITHANELQSLVTDGLAQQEQLRSAAAEAASRKKLQQAKVDALQKATDLQSQEEALRSEIDTAAADVFLRKISQREATERERVRSAAAAARKSHEEFIGHIRQLPMQEATSRQELEELYAGECQALVNEMLLHKEAQRGATALRLKQSQEQLEADTSALRERSAQRLWESAQAAMQRLEGDCDENFRSLQTASSSGVATLMLVRSEKVKEQTRRASERAVQESNEATARRAVEIEYADETQAIVQREMHRKEGEARRRAAAATLLQLLESETSARAEIESAGLSGHQSILREESATKDKQVKLQQQAAADAEHTARTAALENIRTRIEARRKATAQELARTLAHQRVEALREKGRKTQLAAEAAALKESTAALWLQAQKKSQALIAEWEGAMKVLKSEAVTDKARRITQLRNNLPHPPSSSTAPVVVPTGTCDYWAILGIDKIASPSETDDSASDLQQQERQPPHRRRGSASAIEAALCAVMSKAVMSSSFSLKETATPEKDAAFAYPPTSMTTSTEVFSSGSDGGLLERKGSSTQQSLKGFLAQRAAKSIDRLLGELPAIAAALDGGWASTGDVRSGASSSSSYFASTRSRNERSRSQPAELPHRCELVLARINTSVASGGGDDDANRQQQQQQQGVSDEELWASVRDVATYFSSIKLSRPTVMAVLRFLGTIAPHVSDMLQQDQQQSLGSGIADRTFPLVLVADTTTVNASRQRLLSEVHRLQVLATTQHLWRVQGSDVYGTLVPMSAMLLQQSAEELLARSSTATLTGNSSRRVAPLRALNSDIHRVPFTLLSVASLALTMPSSPAGQDTAIVASWRALCWVRLMCHLALDDVNRHQQQQPGALRSVLVQFLASPWQTAMPERDGAVEDGAQEQPHGDDRDLLVSLAARSLDIALHAKLSGPDAPPPSMSASERRLFGPSSKGPGGSGGGDGGMAGAYEEFHKCLDVSVGTFCAVREAAMAQRSAAAAAPAALSTSSHAISDSIVQWLGPLLLTCCRFLAVSLEVGSMFPHALKASSACGRITETLYGEGDPRAAECRKDAQEKEYLQELAFLQLSSHHSGVATAIVSGQQPQPGAHDLKRSSSSFYR